MKKIIFAFLFIAVCALALSACNKNADANKSGVVKVETYRESSSPINYSVEDKNTAAIMFNTKKAFSGVEVYCTTMGNENQNVSVSLYEFQTDYPTTVKTKNPLLTQIFKNIASSSWLMLKFKENPAGNYLLVIHNGSKHINVVSEAPSPTLQDRITNYYNGVKIETGSFRNRILFDEIYYGELVDSNLYIGTFAEETKPVEN